MSNPTDLYAAARDRLIAELRVLDEVEAGAPVPTCPGWSVSDVVAHVSGLVADLLAGVQPPLGTDEMTARQVGERRGMTLGEICDEWANNADGIADYFEGREVYALGLTADLAVHTHDIAEAIDSVSPPPIEATLAGCERYVPLLQERAAKACDIALTITLDGEATAPTEGSAPLHLQTTPTDFLRSVTGRRTRSQVEALDWEGDPARLLDDAFTQYGPFRPEGD
ncbi:MAG: maleylpyruvate isomerase family mycothiol-dependent enzyme [Actinomycetota bacterium]